MERLKIVVNFKHTKEEIELYNELISYSSAGSYIKDVLLGRIERKPKRKEKETLSSNNKGEVFGNE